MDRFQHQPCTKDRKYLKMSLKGRKSLQTTPCRTFVTVPENRKSGSCDPKVYYGHRSTKGQTSPPGYSTVFAISLHRDFSHDKSNAGMACLSSRIFYFFFKTFHGPIHELYLQVYKIGIYILYNDIITLLKGLSLPIFVQLYIQIMGVIQR